MDQPTTTVPYIGRRPSPARRWAPPLEFLVGAAVLGNATQFALNLLERHNLQRARTLRPVSHVFFEDTLSTLNAVSRIMLVVLALLLVVSVVWSNKRRSPQVRRDQGEPAVEPPLGLVSRKVYAGFWAALALSFAAYEIARSSSHVGMTVDDFISYRTWIAIAAGFRTAMWGAYLALVIRATRLQEYREAATTGPVPVPPSPPAPSEV